MNHVTPRSNNFFYIEVWDKQKIRDAKLCEIFGGEKSNPEYVAGSQQRLDKYKDIKEALFWKTRETAEFRIECLNRNENIRNNFKFIIKCLSREEFLRVIPDAVVGKSSCGYHKRNLKLKVEELRYLEKLKNVNR